MSMPYHFVLVRHGESEANIVRNAAKAGDDSLYTAEFTHRPDHQFRLTKEGVRQSKMAGEWIKKHVLEAFGVPQFERSYCSPYVRSIETAAHLQLPLHDGWRLEYMVREQDFGDIEGITTTEFQKQFSLSFKKRQRDPLFWKPPGGESVIEMAETRVRELYHTLHRDAADKSVIVVSHGMFLRANRLALEQPTPREWGDWGVDPNRGVHNAHILHYSRINPVTGEISPYVRWVRSVCPWMSGLEDPGEWQEFGRRKYSNEELLEYAEAIAHLHSDDAPTP